MTFQISVLPSGRGFTAQPGEPILAAAIREGVGLPYGCKDGACGSCKCHMESGHVVHGPHQAKALTADEEAAGYVLTCCATPQTDVVLTSRQVTEAGAFPVRKMPVRLSSLTHVSPDVAVLRLQLPATEAFQYHAGQYVEFLLRDGDRRSYSMANAPHNQGTPASLELHIRHMPGGKFTDQVFGSLKEKDILRIEGPYGSFFLREDSGKPLVFLASGTGFAPIKALIEHMRFKGSDRPVAVYWGGRRPADLYMHDWMLTMATQMPQLTYVPVVSDALAQDEWKGRTGFVHHAVLEDFDDLSGHEVGDKLLQRVAEGLRNLTQPSDLVARLGGDEFALVLPEASLDDAQACAETAQQAIRAVTLREAGRQHQISASIGIVAFPAQGREVAALLANADLAMYKAKDLGRGRWHIFSDEDPVREQLDERVLWKQQITEALHQGSFEMHFQPIVDIRTRRRSHLEALLRMRSADGELIMPHRFIGVAEKTGQIQAIDHWVLSHTLEVLAKRGDLHLAVNLSANAMDDPKILSSLRALLERYRIDPARLSFEITETVAINSLSSATRLMLSIKELGCRFALDDFGSGYASYAYLRQLPVDDIKIDGAFIRELPNNREDRIFVKAITDMAHGAGKRVIAEFVETTEVLTILEELGVDCAQGYLFSKPLTLSEL